MSNDFVLVFAALFAIGFTTGCGEKEDAKVATQVRLN